MAQKAKRSKWSKCPQSGKLQMLAWNPDGKGYPGAVVCISCTFGVLIRKGSNRPATSQAGYDGTAGVVRTHYVTKPVRNATEPMMKYA